MPMNPKALKSYMEAKAEDESYEDEDEDTTADAESYEDAESESESDHDEEAEADEYGEESPEFEEFESELLTYIEDIQDAAEGVDDALSHDEQPIPEVVETMKEQLAQMPESVVDGIREHLVGMPWEQVESLVADLNAQSEMDDPEQVAGWLYWAAKNVGA